MNCLKRCIFLSNYSKTITSLCRGLSCQNDFKCKLLVVGAGPAGCSVAWRFSNKFKTKEIIVLEPSEVHYYQPSFTLVGVGINKLSQSRKSTKKVLPRNVVWFKDKADDFDPGNNMVYTACGFKIFYDYMVIAVGLQNDYQKIIGLKEALNDPNAPVTTIYSPMYCEKCWCKLKGYKGGHAVFTFPKQPGKCPGAAQKIMYLAHDYWKQNKVEHSSSITYNTGGESLFGVAKYANALNKVARNKNIVINYGLELVEIHKQFAVFLSCNGKTIFMPYNFLHVTPPMSPPECLTKCEDLLDEAGYLDVNMYTLQHKRYCNVYGLGDCTGTPNSKTAAAIGSQSYVVGSNIWNHMYGKPLTAKYDGYGACTVYSSFKTAIIAEFLYDKKICETFPFDQSKESRFLCYLNKRIFPYLYWNRLLKGKWNGPASIRKIVNPLKL